MSDTTALKRRVGWALHQIRWAPRRVAKGVRDAREKIYFRIRETPRGHALLRAAEFARSPRDHKRRQQLAQEFATPIQAPRMDPVRGFGLGSSHQMA